MSASLKRLAGLPAAIGIAALVGACAPVQPRSTSAPSVSDAGVAPAALHWQQQPLAIKDLAGMRPADIVALLGQPDLTHREPPATVWQYRSADCVVNLFFYDKAGGSPTLTYTEAWQRSLGSGPGLTPCRDASAPLKTRLLTSSPTPPATLAAGF